MFKEMDVEDVVYFVVFLVFSGEDFGKFGFE